MRYPKQQLSQYLNAMQRGSAAVEMALLLPILILMLDGVLEFGLILHNESVLSSASSVAARAGIAKGSPKLEPIEIAQIAIDYCQNNLISITNTSVLPSVDIVQATDPMFQKPLQVTVHFSYHGLLFGTVLSALQISPELSATSVMYNE
jgi:Flp pilus assembly protein TadG